MGLVYAKLKLLNAGDVVLFKRGMLEKDKIRQVEVEALVDSGATDLVVPEHIAAQLVLDLIDSREVELSDGASRTVKKVGPVEIRFENRICVLGAIVLGNEVLLGSIPMEDMDVLVDPKRERLIVNPDNPYLPKAKVK
ncbi:MAG: clan AA aspartic protease [Candidatus Coatesbacteria bacterium]|nr:clan AA aspartic protease [Candidatus Coatesbacteria bacterium]